jgi:hypothetical protein
LTHWVEVRDEQGHLLFRYDPKRDLIEYMQRGKRIVIDLTQYKERSYEHQPA